MITYKEKPGSREELLKILNPVVEKWFFSRYKDFSLPQLYGVMEIHSRNNILLSAPTGATKTLTGFLSILNELIDNEQKGVLEDKIYAVYISPLKALNEDIAVNLMEPLEEMEKIAGKKSKIRVAVRTGDTTQSERSRMLRKPPHILITTPESLAILLTTIKFKENLRNVQWMIIDEIHALAENKRGVHLSLSMERLQLLSPGLTRVGLSATVAPLQEVAKFLAGYQSAGELRPVKIIDVNFVKKMDLKVLSPVDDLINTDTKRMHQKMYEMMHSLIQDHKTTLIFTNTRAATERVVNYLKEKFPGSYTAIGENEESKIGAHHSSLSKGLRRKIENQLREGKLKCVVSSTSLELGMDIGYIDLVILLGSPKSVARAIQRVGRAGHKMNEVSKGRMIVMDRDDLIECSVLAKSAIERKIDRIHIPRNSLDVLAQQIYGFAIADRWNVDDLYNIVKKSYCFYNLNREDFDSIIYYLAGWFSKLESRYVYAKIWYDETTREIGRKGKLARILYMTNIGTIPDESFVTVKIHGSNEVVGKIDESFLERLKKGDVFTLGGDKYIFMFSQGMSAFVRTSIDRPPTIPNWVSEMLPLSFDLALEIGRFRSEIRSMLEAGASREDMENFIANYLYAEGNTVKAVYNYMKEQYDFFDLPTHNRILVERYEADGYKYLIFNSLYGRRVNDVLSRAIAFIAAKTHGRDVQVGISDNGFYIVTLKEFNLQKILSYLKAEKLDLLMYNAIDKTEVLGRRFRHCAARSLMILRSYRGNTKTASRQQLNSVRLLKSVREISEDFPILREAKREVLEDMMDIENAKKVVEGIEQKKIRVKEINIGIPSPFAFNLVLLGRSDLIKIEEKHEFLKRMHNEVLAKIELKRGKRNKAEID